MVYGKIALTCFLKNFSKFKGQVCIKAARKFGKSRLVFKWDIGFKKMKI